MKFGKFAAGMIGMGMMSFLPGCSDGQDKIPVTVTETAPVEFPEGVNLTGFYMTHQGMSMNPYYILRVRDDGIYMKTTNRSPDCFQMSFSMNAEYDMEAEYFGFIDTVQDGEYASVAVVDESVLQELEQAIVEAGALSWNGFNESRSMEGVMDAGDSYNLFITLSDGSTVSVHGYNARPGRWSDLSVRVMDIFEAHQDYSRYEY